MVTTILNRLKKRYEQNNAKEKFGDIVLLVSDQQDPHDVVIATLLAARTTDKQVAKVYPQLKRAFPTIAALSKASLNDIESRISTIGLYKQKAKAIFHLARILQTTYKGIIPQTMEQLVELPGIGRKTASVILSTLYQIPSIAVDTHVYRVARRLRWAKSNGFYAVEREIKITVPQERWNEVNRLFVPFGREFCKAQSPRCFECPIADQCPYKNKTKQIKPRTIKA